MFSPEERPNFRKDLRPRSCFRPAVLVITAFILIVSIVTFSGDDPISTLGWTIYQPIAYPKWRFFQAGSVQVKIIV